jgi:hypothetical protein
MKLLSVSADAKTIKGEKQGFLTGILYLAPANTSGINVCAAATDGCKAGCLNKAGRAAIFPMIEQARIRKTRELFADRNTFLVQLRKDIQALVRKADRENMIPCVRLNGTSDLPWLGMRMAEEFPGVQFYDYTKIPNAHLRTSPNYHITFSKSEVNAGECFSALTKGISVAVVFAVKKGRALPATYGGWNVVDGDLSDLRFLDPKGVIVGLRAKGPAKRDCAGFVINPLVQIEVIA